MRKMILPFALLSLTALTGSTAQAAPVPAPASVPDAHPASITASAPFAVYYTSNQPIGPRLSREWHQSGGITAAAALRQALAGGLDPDYKSYWPAGSGINSVTRSGGVIKVDMTAAAAGPLNGGAELAQANIQQLVHTATAFYGTTEGVQFTFNGAKKASLWGHINASAPIKRTSALSTLAAVQIDGPNHNDVVYNSTLITGQAATFEAVLHYKVTNSAGVVVRTGTVMTTNGTGFGAFKLKIGNLGLAPGWYRFRFETDDPSGGAGPAPSFDDKGLRLR